MVRQMRLKKARLYYGTHVKKYCRAVKKCRVPRQIQNFYKFIVAKMATYSNHEKGMKSTPRGTVPVYRFRGDFLVRHAYGICLRKLNVVTIFDVRIEYRRCVKICHEHNGLICVA